MAIDRFYYVCKPRGNAVEVLETRLGDQRATFLFTDHGLAERAAMDHGQGYKVALFDTFTEVIQHLTGLEGIGVTHVGLFEPDGRHTLVGIGEAIATIKAHRKT